MNSFPIGHLAVAGFLMATVMPLPAATITWTGAAGDGLWFTAGNWDTGTSPGATPTDDVLISGDVTVSYVPGENWRPTGLVTVRDGATLIQTQKTNRAYPAGGFLLDGGTYDSGTCSLFTLLCDMVVTNGGIFNLRTSMATESTGTLTLAEGAEFHYFKNTQWSGKVPLILNGGTAILGDGGVSVTVKGQTTDQLLSGKLVASNQYHPGAGQVFDGNVTIECKRFAVQSSGLVHPWSAGRLVCTLADSDWYYQNGGSYIDVPADSSAKFTFAMAKEDVYTYTFGSNATKPKMKYAGSVITAAEFAELFTVEDSSDYPGMVDVYLTPVSSAVPTIADASVYATLVSDTEARISATVNNAGSPAAGLVAVYGTTDAGRTTAGWDHVLDLGTATDGQAVSAVLALEPNTLYYYRLAATNEAGEAWATPNPAFFFSMLEPLAPTNVWRGTVSTDSRVAGNWSLGHVPTETETVFVFDRFAKNELDWYPGTGTDKVADWSQPTDFAKENFLVTFHMGLDNPLTVTGNVDLLGGWWTHEGPSATPTNALYLAVGGDFTIGAAATVTAGNGVANNMPGRSRGYYNAGPGLPEIPAGASYAGDGGTTNAMGFVSYGSILNPLSHGTSGRGDNTGFAGAGVIQLDVAGTLTVDGSLYAIGHGWNGATGHGASSGGSINLRAGSLSGNGTISVTGGQDTGVGSGSGGRLAVRLTDAGADFTDVPTLLANGRGGSANGPTSSAAGTIYLQTTADGEGAGTVLVSNASGLATSSDPGLPVAATHIPSMDRADNLSASTWRLADKGALRVTANTRVRSLILDNANGSQRIFLNGHTLTTSALAIGGTAVSPGTYTATDYPDILFGEGSVVVTEAATILLLL